MSRDFEFKIGMDFCSLQEFKEAIIDHSIMNGREVVFRPNDKVNAKRNVGMRFFATRFGGVTHTR